MSYQRISHKRLSLLWEGAALSLWLCCCWTSRAAAGGAAAAAGQGDGAPGTLGWLLSDKGPFQQSLEFTEAAERYQQGFSTRYKIYREFGRWKVNSLAVEKRNSVGGSGGLALPLDPDFMHTIRQLGRRPSPPDDYRVSNQEVWHPPPPLCHSGREAAPEGEESLTIFVDKRKLNQESSPSGPEGSRSSGRNSNTTASVTLEALHQLAASYFTDRESTLRRLHHLQIASTAIRVTETRTGPLGCSNYDNLDTVSSVLVHSPENKVQLQVILLMWPLVSWQKREDKERREKQRREEDSPSSQNTNICRVYFTDRKASKTCRVTTPGLTRDTILINPPEDD
ncbi:BMP/retinoic acid-inducible neural-specific protein 3 [Collichthys lucidus]|uniref:BMP/retinoic acid-inducible neural-specific protein 3 n=1 Tax=Collichthys lucidus TaxID=240159 RepID=A0A4U5UXR6_COLLU|nr:BMP/retinoic acid-inducible neural-specific protein 3 [Collichthys lucidus]